jgi:hypothetical protein
MSVRVLAAAVLLAAGACSSPSWRNASADQRYCWALGELYQRYVGNPITETSSIRRNDAEAQRALAQCQQRNPGPAIPVLERKLLDAGFTLPPRE